MCFSVCGFHRLAAVCESFICKNSSINGYAWTMASIRKFKNKILDYGKSMKYVYINPTKIKTWHIGDHMHATTCVHDQAQ